MDPKCRQWQDVAEKKGFIKSEKQAYVGAKGKVQTEVNPTSIYNPDHGQSNPMYSGKTRTLNIDEDATKTEQNKQTFKHQVTSRAGRTEETHKCQL